jgi:Rrf2 family transcriptional regulator, nitric oxide-sensitive transcriptional repressor
VRLALQTDYALRTLLYLASRPGRSKVVDVADFYRISVNHLGKVVHRLGKLGYVRNVRGPGGGIELAREPSRISVGAVVRDFEGRSIHLLECVDTPGVCVIQPGCTLRGVLAEAERRQMEYLDGVTLSSLLPTKGDLVTFMSQGQAAGPRRPGA